MTQEQVVTTALEGETLGLQMAEVALDGKAIDPLLLDARGLNAYADFFLIVSGSSERQVAALAEAMVIRAKRTKTSVLGVEGKESSRWILIDMADVVIHVLHEESRAYYNLDALWSDAKRIDIPGAPPPAAF